MRQQIDDMLALFAQVSQLSEEEVSELSEEDGAIMLSDRSADAPAAVSV